MLKKRIHVGRNYEKKNQSPASAKRLRVYSPISQIHDFTNFHELKKVTSKSLFEGKSQDFKDKSFESDSFPILQNDDHESSSLKDVICDMLPQVLTEIEKNNADLEFFKKFFRLIIAGRYPLGKTYRKEPLVHSLISLRRLLLH